MVWTSQFFAGNLIKSDEGNAGRPPTDPKILWLLALGHHRRLPVSASLDELCRSHSAYQWICGNVVSITTPCPTFAPIMANCWISC